MIKQRSKSSIDALILAAASQSGLGVNKAKLVRDLVLPYSKLNSHCDRLVSRKLLLFNPVTRCYQVTSKGEEVLQLTEELAHHYSPFDQMLNKYKSRSEADNLRNNDRVEVFEYTPDRQKSGILGSVSAMTSLLTFEQLYSPLTTAMLNSLPY